MNENEKKLFKEEIRELLSKKLGSEEYSVAIQQVLKTNVTLDAISIFDKSASTNTTPTIYLNGYYKDYQSGVSLEEICDDILSVYEKNKVINCVDMNDFLYFEKIKERIGRKLVNAKWNEELLESCPYTRVLDLAILYFVEVESEEFGKGTILIHNSHLDAWRVTKEELVECANQNAKRFPDVLLQNMETSIRQELKETIRMSMPCELTEEELEEMVEQMTEEVKTPLYVLTNSSKVFGAVNMLDADVLREFCKEHEVNKCVVIPSSLHEVLLIPHGEIDMSSLEYSEMIKEVNATVVNPQDILSDRAYIFNTETEQLAIF